MADEGIYAVFTDPEPLIRVTARMKELGYTQMEAYTPYLVEEVVRSLGARPRYANVFGAVGATVGVALGYLIQWYLNAYDYPINVGGRPPHSAPAFVPATFETGVLLCSLASFVALLVSIGLPRLHRPMFEVDAVTRASIDRYVLFVSSRDRNFDRERTTRDLFAFEPEQIVALGGGEDG